MEEKKRDAVWGGESMGEFEGRQRRGGEMAEVRRNGGGEVTEKAGGSLCRQEPAGWPWFRVGFVLTERETG